MCFSATRTLAALIGAIMVCVSPLAAHAQSGDTKAQEQKPAQPADAGKDKKAEEKKKIDEFAEAERLLGGPAAKPECVWLGRRVVNLLWRDDLDTAFRHLDLYDRFGCPGGHIQSTFRCVVRQGNIDQKATESLNARVHACWINPGLEPTAAATGAPPGAPTAASAPAGTSNQ
jgi:hypothetical protein